MTNKVDFDKYTNNYNELLREGTGFFSSNEEYFAKYKVKLLKEQVLGSPKRILEYGCGIGRNIPYLKEAFPNAEIVGTDISEESLNLASSLYKESKFEVEHDGLDIGKFDLIFVAGVFHHVPITARSMVASVLYERLSTGGDLAIFEHNPYNPITRRIVNDCPYDADAVLLPPRELSEYIKQSGLIVCKKSYCLFVPPWLSMISGLEKYLGWLPLGGQYWVHAVR